MNSIKKFLSLLLAVSLFVAQSSFAADGRPNENNPYDFNLVEESIARDREISDYDEETANINDTYYAQENAEQSDAAAMRKFEREAARLSGQTRPSVAKRSALPVPKTRSFATKIEQKLEELKKNPKIAGFIKALENGWKKFKKWFVKLPGIKHWLDSPYSRENYKKELGKVDYVEKKTSREQLQKGSASSNMLKKGSKEFFK